MAKMTKAERDEAMLDTVRAHGGSVELRWSVGRLNMNLRAVDARTGKAVKGLHVTVLDRLVDEGRLVLSRRERSELGLDFYGKPYADRIYTLR